MYPKFDHPKMSTIKMDRNVIAEPVLLKFAPTEESVVFRARLTVPSPGLATGVYDFRITRHPGGRAEWVAEPVEALQEALPSL